MKVAFTSSNGELIDQHFGMAESFYVWEIAPGTACYLNTVTALVGDKAVEDKTVARAEALADCSMVYTMQIGGPAAAKLIGRKIQPMKTNSEVPVVEIVERLQKLMSGNPPPWMRKLLGMAPPVYRYAENEL